MCSLCCHSHLRQGLYLLHSSRSRSRRSWETLCIAEIRNSCCFRDLGSVPAEAGGDGVTAGWSGCLGSLQAMVGRQLQCLASGTPDFLAVWGRLAMGVSVCCGWRTLKGCFGSFHQQLLDTVFGKVHLVGGDLRPSPFNLIFDWHPCVEVWFEGVSLLWTPSPS